MAEPAYAFTLPSIEDGLALDCRIYHPNDLIQRLYRGEKLKGAIVAHPYAPLGGCYDDAVVISVTETLLELGCVVGTFNFRGAGGSAGRTSWTGRAEQNDYASVVGFLTQYLGCLKALEDEAQNIVKSFSLDSEERQQVLSTDEDSSLPQQGTGDGGGATKRSLSLILAGYSYGSLILARLLSIPAILHHFHSAPLGTPAAEIILRARTLAKQTLKSHLPGTPSLRGRQHADSNASVASESRRTTASPITLGSAEDATARPRSHDSLVRRSLELPGKKLKAHMRRHSHQHQRGDPGSEDKGASRDSSSPSPSPSSPGKASANRASAHSHSLSYTQPTHVESFGKHDPFSSLPDENLQMSYLFISPVLIPLTHTLMPPGGLNFWRSRSSDTKAHSGDADSQDEAEGKEEQFRKAPTLAIFGSEDAFTSEKRLRGWAQTEAGMKREKGEGHFEWTVIENAGHFWREKGVMRRLKQNVVTWVASLETKTMG